ncbi:GrpB family protein [Clostridium tetani]|uniref:GrpB family protein n=1 Tax=Clostridium tetani TaxID=1513 RepID=A0ABY0EQA8_CLOTA|nr:GrpB family protein [Clostridium tetani]KHO39417.1 hypothetical protein OR62_06135 [Clostridium tetani]RXI53059.1 GrpB family protein [Clostridium tetani]RXI67332.1 GrpB family protein [Clostridium tetani]CDI49289.1 glutamate-rich protein GrpB [Clostridium tetani 12124569]
MSKKLSDMSIDELWILFPIFLIEHQDCWEKWYNEELMLLQKILPSNQIRRINHIGSTSIKTIWPKPIIDILVEVQQECNMKEIKEILLNRGYLCMSEGESGISFNKGYTENGFAQKVYHLHLRYLGDNDELYFRDYLNENPDIAKNYESLKFSLWKKYKHNRDGYTDSKTDFITRYTEKAKEKYGSRYC